MTINTNTFIDNEITFFMNSTKGYTYYSRIYPIFNKEPIYLEGNQPKCISFPIPNSSERSNRTEKQFTDQPTVLNQ